MFGIQMYHEEMQVKFKYGCGPIIMEDVAFPYIFNFLRTAETISLNLGRNEVLVIPYKCTFIKSF